MQIKQIYAFDIEMILLLPYKHLSRGNCVCTFLIVSYIYLTTATRFTGTQS